MFINFSRDLNNEMFHGKVVLLDPHNERSPFALVFLIHEMRVRGRWPFLVDRLISDQPEWPDWVSPFVNAEGVLEDGPTGTAPSTLSGALPSVNQAPPVGGASSTVPGRPPSDNSVAREKSISGKIRFAAPDSDTWDQILKVTRTLPSWKACIVEGKSWKGTAEENIAKYKRVTEIGDDLETPF